MHIVYDSCSVFFMHVFSMLDDPSVFLEVMESSSAMDGHVGGVGGAPSIIHWNTQLAWIRGFFLQIEVFVLMKSIFDRFHTLFCFRAFFHTLF